MHHIGGTYVKVGGEVAAALLVETSSAAGAHGSNGLRDVADVCSFHIYVYVLIVAIPL